MIKITQHIPSYCDVDEPKVAYFRNLTELWNIDFVKSFQEDWDGKKFFRYTLDDDKLIAEYDDGSFWWVVGHLEGHELFDLDLPKPFYKD